MLRGKSPLRISFAGGGTDLTEIFEKFGGKVINATIDKYIHETIEKRQDENIMINGTSYQVSDEFTKNLINKIKPEIGFNFYSTNDVNPGRGLGSSSAYAILFTKLVYELQGKILSDNEIVNLVYGIENECGKCGWQDQIATTIGGFNFIEFEKDKRNIYPLRLKYSTLCELEEHLILVYTKREHYSAELQKKNAKIITKDKAERLKNAAEKVKDSLLNDKVCEIGNHLKEAWEAKKNDANNDTNIEELYDLGMSSGAIAGKLLGAGLGGYILFYVNPKQMRLFKHRMINNNYEVLDFHFTKKGVETWRAKI